MAARFEDIPAGLDRTLLHILEFHKGREQAIGRGALVGQCHQMGFRVHERVMRQVINELRKKGTPICSTGGEDGGYWLASGWEELTEFLEREVHPRAMDLLETEKALKQAAEQRWGRYSPAKQYRLEL